MLREVVIDKRVLDGFKRRALARYPNEFIEIMTGEVSGTQANVCALHPIRHKGNRMEIELPDDGDELDEFDGRIGSIHTHPDSDAEPSDTDLAAVIEDGEIVFGICSIRRRNRRRFIAWGFYDAQGNKMDLVISE